VLRAYRTLLGLLLPDLELVVDIGHAQDIVRYVGGLPLLPAIVDLAFQRDDAIADINLDIAGVDITVPGQALDHVVADALVGAPVATWPTASVAPAPGRRLRPCAATIVWLRVCAAPVAAAVIAWPIAPALVVVVVRTTPKRAAGRTLAILIALTTVVGAAIAPAIVLVIAVVVTITPIGHH